MSFCIKCGKALAAGAVFCSECGTPVATTALVPIPKSAEPEVPKGARIKGYVGMGLSIYGLYMAVSGLVLMGYFNFLGLMVGLGTGGESYYSGDPFSFVMSLYSLIFSLVFASYSLPLSIVGKKLCQGSRNAGNESKCCIIGSKLALAALIASIVLLVSSLGNLFGLLFSGMSMDASGF